MIRSLEEGTRPLLLHMHVGRVWWAKALMTIAHILNRVPNSARPDVSHYEILTGNKPVLNYLRVFVSDGFYRIDDNKRTKLAAKANR